MKVGRKNASILKDCAVLDDVFIALTNFNHFFESLVEEINLKVERPSRHITIEIVEIRIVFYWLKTRRPIISFCQHLGERGLAATDVSGIAICIVFAVLLQIVEIKEAEEDGVYLICDKFEILWTILVVEIVDIDG